jgi:hypothetical protein
MVPSLLHVEEQSSTPAASISLHRRQDKDKVKAIFVDVKFDGQERARQKVHFNSATFQQHPSRILPAFIPTVTATSTLPLTLF